MGRLEVICLFVPRYLGGSFDLFFSLRVFSYLLLQAGSVICFIFGQPMFRRFSVITIWVVHLSILYRAQHAGKDFLGIRLRLSFLPFYSCPSIRTYFTYYYSHSQYLNLRS